MTPLPKRKVSRSRRNRRRAHDSITLNHVVQCETCGDWHLAHHVCKACGSYRGETVLNVEDDK